VSVVGHGGSECPTAECVFGTTVTGDFTVEGGTTAKIKSVGGATIPKISGGSLLCGSKNAGIGAIYKVLSPEPLYVLQS
jgi:hypothetical protein